MSGKEYMTEEGLERLKNRLEGLSEELRQLRKYKGEEAIHAGDTWHDNPVLYETESKERALMRTIAETAAKIRNAEIIPAPDSHTARVELGSTVRIRFSDGYVETFRILGEADSDPTSGILSFKTPLGQALLGRKPGDRICYTVQELVEEVEVLSIE